MDILAHLVSKLDADIGLVRRLVLREARVAIRAHEGAAVGADVGDEVVRDRCQSRLEICDEFLCGRSDSADVAVLVRFEPWTVVVVLKFMKESEQRRSEVCLAQLRPFRLIQHIGVGHGMEEV